MKKHMSIFLMIILIFCSFSDIYAATIHTDDIPAPNLRYSAGENYIDVWLSDTVDVNGYNVFFSKQLNGTRLLEFNCLDNNTSNEVYARLDVSSLESGNYFMGVDAWRFKMPDTLRSSYYSYVEVQITTSIVPAPTSINASAGINGYVTVTWSKDELADGYFIFYSMDGGQYKGFGSVNEKGKYYFTGQLPANHQYSFAVKQYRRKGEEVSVSNLSAPSQTVYISAPTVTTPTNVAVKSGYNCVTITWNPVAGADGYYIFKTDYYGNNPIYVDKTDAATCYKTITGLDWGSHYYRVRAYDIVDNQPYYSDLSNVQGAYVTYNPYQANSYNATYTVYVTRTGAKYHRYGCQYLRQSCIPTSLSHAISQGYTPCSVCW